MAVPKISKRKLSASVDGRQVKVTGVASPGLTIHTALTAGQVAGNFDEVWLWAVNTHTASVDLTVEFGGVVNPDDRIVVTLARNAGPILVVPGLLLQNASVVKAFASVANVVMVGGYVNLMTE